MAFNYSTVSPGDDVLAAHPNNLFLDIKAAHHQEAGATLLVNADIDAAAAIAYSKLNLALSIVNGDINAAAAIAYSKLNLTGNIVNADINASAAIALSKLAALTGSRVLESTAGGIISASSATSTNLSNLVGGTVITEHLHDTRRAVGSNSRGAGAGSGTQAITGVGFQPRLIIIHTVASGGAANAHSHGHATGTTDEEVARVDSAGGGNVESGNIISIINGANSQKATISAVGSDGFTLNWTEVGSSIAVNFVYQCIA